MKPHTSLFRGIHLAALIAIAVVSFSNISLAFDNVYLHGGISMVNVKIIDTLNNQLRVLFSDGTTRGFPLRLVDAMIIGGYDSTKESIINDPNNPTSRYNSASTFERPDTSRPSHLPDLKLLPLSFLAFGLAWDHLAHIDELPDGSDKSRETLIGYGSIVIGLFVGIEALHSEDVEQKK